MAEGLEIKKLKDGRVLVLLHPLCAITKEAILALLAELGIDPAIVIFLLPSEAAEQCTDIDDVPVIVPIDSACHDAPELVIAGRQFGQAGGCVVILSGDGFSYQGLHPVAEGYGTQCGWSAEALKSCIDGLGSAAPRDSDGRLIARSESIQVKC